MDIEFQWPGDVDHDELHELFNKYDAMEKAFLRQALSEDNTRAVYEGVD